MDKSIRQDAASWFDAIARANGASLESVYGQYRRDPGSVAERRALVFGGYDLTETARTSARGARNASPSATDLVLAVWEAQFGDVANGAQVIIDQVIASAESRRQRVSGLTLLLPHGDERQGPERSRLEDPVRMLFEV